MHVDAFVHAKPYKRVISLGGISRKRLSSRFQKLVLCNLIARNLELKTRRSSIMKTPPWRVLHSPLILQPMLLSFNLMLGSSCIAAETSCVVHFRGSLTVILHFRLGCNPNVLNRSS